MSSKQYLKQQEKIRAFPEVEDGDIVLSNWGTEWDCAKAHGLLSAAKKTGPSGAVKKFYIVTADNADGFRSIFAKWKEAKEKREEEYQAEIHRKFEEGRRKYEEDKKRRAQLLGEDDDIWINCRSCEFSYSADGLGYECRKNPPCVEGFPGVEPHWWCGEWERMDAATIGDAEDAKWAASESDRWPG
jgi:hypothetical protein